MSSFLGTESIIASINAVNKCLVDQSNQDSRTSCFTSDSIGLNYGIAILMSIVCFVCSIITNNDSWVDRFWSIIPVVCAWVHTLYPSNGSFKPPTEITTQLLFTIVITIWGVRLTYNFYRKGGYKAGGEDYRWAYVRTWPLISHPAVWFFFSLLVISAFQVFLLVLIALPVAQLPNTPATASDVMFLLCQLLWLILEGTADQQQWEFQQYKQNKKGYFPIPSYLKGDCERGFLTHGLFSFSRHPNVLCEQLFWLNVFFASSVHAGITVSFIGCFILVILTNCSSVLTEVLSGRKYPMFSRYKKTTPFIYPSIMSTRCDIDHIMSLAEDGEIARGRKTK